MQRGPHRQPQYADPQAGTSTHGQQPIPVHRQQVLAIPQHQQSSQSQLQTSPPYSAQSNDTAPSQRLGASKNAVFANQFDRISDRLGGAQSLKGLLVAISAFFVLFIILVLTKFYYDHEQFTNQSKVHFTQSLNNQAMETSRRIDSEFAWIEQGLFTEGTPKQITTLIAQGDTVEGVALVDASGTVMSFAGAQGERLSTLDSRNFPNGDKGVLSIVSSDGIAKPVLIRRRADVFLLATYAPQTFIGGLTPNAALIMDGGRVIDGGANVTSADALSVYNINAPRLAGLTKSSEDSSLIAFKIAEKSVWLGATRVPKSFLSIIDIQNRGMNSGIVQNLVLFGLLLLGMGWLIWMLVSQLMKQMDILREKQTDDEVSTQRYQAAVDGSKGGVWEIDLAKNTAYLSPSLASVFNMPEIHTTISMPQFLGLFSAADRERLFGAIRRSHINGDFDIELGLAQLPIYMACRGRPSVRGSDHAKIIIGMALDVTEMRGAQARLQSAETRLHDALKSMTDSFVIWDQMDRLVLWNERFESFFGFQPGQLQVGIDHATVEYHGMANIASVTERPEGNEMELNDGRWIRYSETYTADGGRVSVGTEVSAIRTREKELQINQEALEKTINVLRESQIRIVELAENYEQEKIRAEEASQSKSEFLANMSHELRTPLNAINGFSDIMKKELFGPLGDSRYKEYVSDILFSGQHLLSLINDILDMSKIEAGKMTLNTEELQINEMIEQVIRIVRGRADENRLKLVFIERPANEVEADPRAVKQVLLNLMTNAIKFTPEGGTVTIAVEPKSAGLIVRVKDTGIGISKDNIERLAQPFEQIDSQHSRKHEGTGLGLALSKSLVELHGGNFTIESTLGEGTTVIFTLPSTPPVVKEKVKATEVGSEISRLANDIADVLSAGEAHVSHAKSDMSKVDISAALQKTDPDQPPQVRPSPPPVQVTQPHATHAAQSSPQPYQAPSAPNPSYARPTPIPPPMPTQASPYAPPPTAAPAGMAPPRPTPQTPQPSPPKPYRNSAA